MVSQFWMEKLSSTHVRPQLPRSHLSLLPLRMLASSPSIKWQRWHFSAPNWRTFMASMRARSKSWGRVGWSCETPNLSSVSRPRVTWSTHKMPYKFSLRGASSKEMPVLTSSIWNVPWPKWLIRPSQVEVVGTYMDGWATWTSLEVNSIVNLILVYSRALAKLYTHKISWISTFWVANSRIWGLRKVAELSTYRRHTLIGIRNST
jgi:hypothetical protein